MPGKLSSCSDTEQFSAFAPFIEFMTEKQQDREGQQDPQVLERNRGSVKNILHRFDIKQHPDPGQFYDHGADQERI